MSNNPLNNVDPLGLRDKDCNGEPCTGSFGPPSCSDGMPAWSCLVYEGMEPGGSWLNFVLGYGWSGNNSSSGGGGGGQAPPRAQPQPKPSAPSNCHTLAAGQVPSSSASTWWAGYVNASSMLDNWIAGTGATNTNFGPNSPESQQMKGAYGLAGNVASFLNGGPSSGFQNFGVKGLFASGLNPTAQFVGSYGWSMSLSGGNLNITLTNATTMYSAFYHAPGLNPNPPTRFDSVFNPGRHPMGRVNQTFNIQVPCS